MSHTVVPLAVNALPASLSLPWWIAINLHLLTFSCAILQHLLVLGVHSFDLAIVLVRMIAIDANHSKQGMRCIFRLI